METERQPTEGMDAAPEPCEAPADSAVAAAVEIPATEENATATAPRPAAFDQSLPAKPLNAHYLKNGFIRFSKTFPVSKNQLPVNPDEAKKSGPVFGFVNKNLTKPIYLFGNQVVRLIKELPTAYLALQKADLCYRSVVCENKDNLVTLEVNQWKGKTYLALKKYFKASKEARASLTVNQEIDENAWIPTKSSLSLDPVEDDPNAMLEFVMSCCQ